MKVQNINNHQNQQNRPNFKARVISTVDIFNPTARIKAVAEKFGDPDDYLY